MTGMKEGAGEDPFAEDEEEDTDDTIADDGAHPDRDDDRSNKRDRRDTTTGSTDRRTTVETSGGSSQQSMQIPYKYRRDGVQDGRDRVPLFLMPETKRAEREARRELEERFDDDVSLTDVREALVKTGLQHLDEVEVQLENWGYGMTFE